MKGSAWIVVIFCLASVIAGVVLSPVRAQKAAEWSMGGQNLSNTRSQPAETIINPQNVGNLVPKWVFTTGGDVSATPAVVGDAVYVPDWAGNFFKIDATTGQSIWTRRIPDYTGEATAFSRTYPAVDGNVVYIGTQRFTDVGVNTRPALVAVNATTGDAIWVTKIDMQLAAPVMTQSPVVYNGVIYVGISSLEEFVAVNVSYPCCTFRGSVVAVNALTGSILWRTYMVPDNQGKPGGYSGAAIWSNTPVVDPARRTVYVTTGNNYTLPRSVQQCVDAGGSACDSADNHFDSVVALDMDTGAIKWTRGVRDFDAWTFGCLRLSGVNCPTPSGKDSDFGSGPNLFTTNILGQTRQLLGVGEKSGVYWALDPDNGKIIWATRTGPAGVLGGILWGTATDGQRVYVANANSNRATWTINGQNINAGFWSALDTATGQILWQTPDPLRTLDMGAVSVANGVVFAGSVSAAGTLYAMDATSGHILWSFASGGSVISGPAVVNGVVYWGSGYGRFVLTPNNKLYAFGLP